jgi:hypothetical protein
MWRARSSMASALLTDSRRPRLRLSAPSSKGSPGPSSSRARRGAHASPPRRARPRRADRGAGPRPLRAGRGPAAAPCCAAADRGPASAPRPSTCRPGRAARGALDDLPGRAVAAMGRRRAGDLHVQHEQPRARPPLRGPCGRASAAFRVRNLQPTRGRRTPPRVPVRTLGSTRKPRQTPSYS